MSAAWVIATREIRERYRLFIVAAAVAVIPFLIALAPAAKTNRGLAIVTVAAMASVGYAFSIALAMGVSTVGRDLAERRLSFYLSKPVSPAALWFGKAGASLFVAFASLLIIALPAYLVARSDWDTLAANAGPAVAWILRIAIVTIFLIAHAASTMTRSRSILVALDFILALLAVAILAIILWPVILGGGDQIARVIAISVGGAVLLILVAAPVWQLARGRTDARRSHRALSTFLWTSVAILLGITAAYGVWLRSASPTDLVRVWDIDQAPSGGSAIVFGETRYRGDYLSTFVMNGSTNEYKRFPAAPWSGVVWSADGTLLAWMQPIGIRPHIRDLDIFTMSPSDALPRPTDIRANLRSIFALSDNGSRIAVITNGLLSVHDVAQKRVLASAAGFDENKARLMFVGRDVVRVIEYSTTRSDTSTVRVAELNVPGRKLTRFGERAFPRAWWALSTSADASRIFVRSSAEIVDGQTLATVANLGTPIGFGSAMLSDGSVVAVRIDNGVRLRLFDRDGQPRSAELPLSNAKNAWVSGETTDGKIIVMGSSAPMGPDRNVAMYVIDGHRFVVERTIAKVKGPVPQWFGNTRRFQAGQPLIGRDENGTLVKWDPRTGAVSRWM